MKIVNMTPHAVDIVDADGTIVRTYPTSGETIRLASSVERLTPLPDGTPTSRTVFGEPTGLPDCTGETIYIVSQLVKSALPDRADLVVPAEIHRDTTGQIIGCRSLGR